MQKAMLLALLAMRGFAATARSRGTNDEAAWRRMEAQTARLEQKNDASPAKYI